ncbi:AMP-binding protein [Cryptosporangium sp. NPDC051539]|uniref:AMP-binding protein n=1 Tax=Cryptosporangium sp. NPDC051539 TaxID=3363962 RepID=UPI003791897C
MSTARTMPGLLAEAAERYAGRAAIVDGAVRLSYAALAHEVEVASRAYWAAGVRPGDRVAVWAPNQAEFVVALCGAQRIGAAVVPLNTRYRGPEAHTILERSRASALVVADGFLGTGYLTMLAESGDRPPHLHTIVDLGDSGHPDAVRWTDFLAGAERADPAEAAAAAAAVTPDTVCDILYTSGTTGLPKGVMSAHRQTIGVAAVWARGAGLSPADRYAIVNPFFHSFGYKAGFVAAFTAGSTVYPVRTFDPVALMSSIERERITVLPGAPTIFTTLLNSSERNRFDLSSLRFAIAGAASVPENLFVRMLDELGFDQVGQAYGLTECVVATQSRPGEDPRHVAETTGPAVSGLEVRIAGADGSEQPVGVDGEIWIRGENVMLGYFEDPESTRAAIDPDGWLHTGDLGRTDEHGCVTITGRLKDMFTVGGFNVYPAEVENVVADHPDVAETAVIGIPDERLGSVARAYVTVRPGHDLDPDDLITFCRHRLANFKAPRDVVVLDELPRNASGKVLKRVLAGED